MLRTLLGYAVLAILGVFAVKLVLSLLGMAIGLMMTLLWFAAIGFIFYVALRILSPGTARRVREVIKGKEPPAAA